MPVSGAERDLILVTLTLFTGLRQGEALGLRWSDVDLDACTLRVGMALQRVRRGPGNPCPLVLVEPKTSRSRRSIDFPRAVAEVLRRHRAAQVEGAAPCRTAVGGAHRRPRLHHRPRTSSRRPRRDQGLPGPPGEGGAATPHLPRAPARVRHSAPGVRHRHRCGAGHPGPLDDRFDGRHVRSRPSLAPARGGGAPGGVHRHVWLIGAVMYIHRVYTDVA